MSTVQYGAALEDARRDSEVAESALAERSEEFRAQRRRAQIGVAEVMKSLPADAALVSFVRYERTVFRDAGAMPLRERARTSSRPTSSYLAFVVRHNQPAVVVPVGSVRIIDTLVSQWRTDLAAEGMAPAQLPSGGSVRSSRGSGAVLRRRVWDRLATHLGDARRVFIVPDGTLSLLPFAALPVGQRSYLLETGPAVHYLSAERDLVPSSETSAELGLLALGGASFDDPTLFAASAKPAIAAKAGSGQAATLRGALQICGDLRSVTFPPLNGTTQEVRDLSVLWRNGAKPESGAARVLVGRDASEAMFKREAHRYRVLHLATHGFFLSDACSPTATGTRGVGRLVGTRPTNVENPLLLSGIALAGANRRVLASPDEDDGILTAEEVASLNLQGVEWAVLSACDTGVGEIKAGEGVLGLRRAFQVAGARTVIMSLWSVEDQSTRVWMRALYDGRIRRNLDTAAAVHEASLAVLHARRAKGQNTSPFYWAAFVAAGDWR
jgi:CHAT domain-containing protein